MKFGFDKQHPYFLKSIAFAIQGLRIALKTERTIRIIIGLGITTIIAGLWVGLDAISWAIILLSCGVVVGAELMNTAIETVVDLVSPEYHPLAGRAKDIAAASVWSLCMLVLVVGVVIFIRALFFV